MAILAGTGSAVALGLVAVAVAVVRLVVVVRRAGCLAMSVAKWVATAVKVVVRAAVGEAGRARLRSQGS